MLGHTLRRLKGQFTITDCYGCRIGYVNVPGVFGAVDCILSSSSLMPRLRMSRAVPLPCLYNFMACRAADLPFAIYHCLLSRWRRRRFLLPNLFLSSERWNSVLPHVYDAKCHRPVSTVGVQSCFVEVIRHFYSYVLWC